MIRKIQNIVYLHCIVSTSTTEFYYLWNRNTVPTATNHRNLSNYTDFIRIRLCLFHFVIELRGTCNIIYLLWLLLNEKTLTANCYEK